MKLGESIRISWRSITGHKLRSTLTTLGIIIGISAVIVFMVLGGGFEANILDDFDTDEETSMQVITTGELDQPVTPQPEIYTQNDVEAVRSIEGVNWVAPDATIPGTTRVTHNESDTAVFRAIATNPSRFESNLFEIVEGEAFDPNSTDEAVINEFLVERLESDPSVGDTITVQGGPDRSFTITGIVDDDTGTGIPPRVYLPLSFYNSTAEHDGEEKLVYSSLLLDAEQFDNLEETRDRVQAYFDEESDAEELKEPEHEIAVQTVEDAAEQFQQIISQIALFLGGIAAIALVVGSIGIANIMIVSVTERTREIGIMKAVGAKRRDIMQLFLVESLILGIIGAIFGVLLGLGVGYLGVSLAGWPMVYPLNWIAIAVFVGVVVGVVSGLYPAWRAARIDPIEALRRE